MNTANNKKVMVVMPQDFPYRPDTNNPIDGIKTMELLTIGYELTRYLDRRINEGTIALKDVVVELCGEKEWKEFSDEYENPETNADAFVDYLNGSDSDMSYPWDNILALETDDSIMFVPIEKEDEDDNNWAVVYDLRNIIEGMCAMYNERPIANITKTTVGKVEVKTSASIDPIFEPMFTEF